LRRGNPFRFADSVLSFANRNVENLLGKLDGITRTFGHEASMPQAEPRFQTMRFQTEALPPVTVTLFFRVGGVTLFDQAFGKGVDSVDRHSEQYIFAA